MSAYPPRPAPDPQDPFASLESGATVIRPNPGARSATQRMAPSGDSAAQEVSLPQQGLNPLVTLANRLLMSVTQIRSTRSLNDPASLKNSLSQALRDFGTAAAAQGIAPQHVMAARYVLCTAIDEAANDTPWGGGGRWGQHSLLVTFHNEAYGGEKVFQLMARLAAQPAEHRDLLELIYVAIAHGFEGRFRAIENGRAQLEAVREKLARIVLQARGDHAKALAQHWQVEPIAQRAVPTWLPLLVVTLILGLLLSLVYLGLSFSLGARSDPIFGQIQGLRLTPPVAAVAQPAPQPRLAAFLRPEIAAGLVVVRDEVDRSVVTMRGDGLFEPGSATLAAPKESLLRRIAEALTQVPGAVLVTGHTDSQPIQSARFPSNWHLSQERAVAVRDLLAGQKVDAARLRAEGRADGEPVVLNDSASNRALNRRVEVTLFVSAAPGVASAALPAGPANTPSAVSASGVRP